ncbi:hypothetical protein PO909_012585 [Leuciscus waleckii]
MSGKILRDVGKWCNPGAQMDLEVDLGKSHHLSPPPSTGTPQASARPALMRLTTVYLHLFYLTGKSKSYNLRFVQVLLAGGRVLERALQEVFGICSQHSFSEAVFLRRERSPLTLQALIQPRSSSASEHSQRRGEGSCCCCDVCRGKPASGED